MRMLNHRPQLYLTCVTLVLAAQIHRASRCPPATLSDTSTYKFNFNEEKGSEAVLQ
jgi:hypothetical protein